MSQYNKLVFHGSNIIVQTPQMMPEKFAKDFGSGYYVTEYSKQAERWAKHKVTVNRSGKAIVSLYDFALSQALQELNYLYFEEMNDEWLDFIINCRSGKNHSHDVVEGPMADDQIYNNISNYINGIITRKEFWILAKFNYPTHQIAFHTEQSLQYLHFRDFYELK